MKQRNIFKRAAAMLVSTASLLTCSVTAFPAADSVQAADCVIDTGKTYQ